MTFRTAARWLALVLPVVGCKDKGLSLADDAAPPAVSATARVLVEAFKPLDDCSCPGFKLEVRIVREQDDVKLEPARRHNLLPELRISGGGKDWVFKPAAECAFPQRLFANTLKLAVACTPTRLVIAGPHWASAFAVGREVWTRRIDGDPSLANDLLRPMLTAAGVGAPQWADSERADPSKVRISCEKLNLDQSWVQIADWGGNTVWYDTLTGRQR